VHGTAARGRGFALYSEAVVSQRKHDMCRMLQNTDDMIVLGAHDEEIQLEQGLPWSRGGFHADSDVDGLYRTGRDHRVGNSMPGYPEYVHLQYRQVTVRHNVSLDT
jgi:hypothetical protein